MTDEAAPGPASTSPGRRLPRGSPREQSPLRTRAPFLQNRSWELVVSLNQAACERGRAQHGPHREAHDAVAEEWRRQQQAVTSLEETLDFLRHCHRRAPFLFFNGNTFADIGRRLAATLFADLPPVRLREVTSAVAHYIAGVLDRESMVEIVDSLCAAADLQPGDRVQTLRGSTAGTVLRLLPDGRVLWRPDGSRSELTALPEALRAIPRSEQGREDRGRKTEDRRQK